MVDIQSRVSGLQGASTTVGKRRESAMRPSVSDIRELIPATGLREYWYPALEDCKVRNKPVGLMMLGEQLVFFRGGDGLVKALRNTCLHRGGSLMHGDCHFRGTVTCPYHGWTYDGEGNVVAVLPEGPESRIPGQVKQRAYPTLTLKGMVFLWMGESEPAPPEEDIPCEFFEKNIKIIFSKEIWPVSWNAALENGNDAHVPYVHRNSLRAIIGRMGAIAGPNGHGSIVVNERAVLTPFQGGNWASRGYRKVWYPGINAHWPKSTWRNLISWVFTFTQHGARQKNREWPDEWGGVGFGHHLPCLYRGVYKTHMYTRNSVPINEHSSRQIYFKTVWPKTRLGWLWEWFNFHVWYHWAQYENFSKQDFRAVAPQRYDTLEYLSATDSHQVLWRRLILRARGMMSAREASEVHTTTAESFSSARQQEASHPKE